MSVNTNVTYPRLTLYSEENYQGRSAIYRGNLGIVSLDAKLGGIESLRFYSTSSSATLVLFSRTGFKGYFRVFRGVTNLREIEDIVVYGGAESLLSSNAYLTLDQIRAIRNSGQLPDNYRRI
ncbi:hypothetical protein [Paenibacillus sacheonensis]|uniref:Uncharacterized protein n=1 Tax=Paenibacillus sacheonensis TaxID=742054 RepID=A0A7X4YTK8_9BACL|nr:hypothetical protein [Paenibacillus sacheonensis]MBM7567566.1 hypothetical protein [Paenibacillus sacheonensis]NBC71331.1 hypothetical protein [Paenibacillus sacheonensis]